VPDSVQGAGISGQHAVTCHRSSTSSTSWHTIKSGYSSSSMSPPAAVQESASAAAVQQQDDHTSAWQTHLPGTAAAGRQQLQEQHRAAAQNSSKQGRNGASSWKKSSSSRKQKSSSNGPRGSSVDEQQSSRQLTTTISHATSWQQLQQLLQQHRPRFNHIHAAALLNTTSRLVQYHRLAPEQQQEFAGFYVEALQLGYSQAQGAARPRELSSMLWAVARVGLHPGGDWLAAYLSALQPQLQTMNAQDVGLLVWALARFKYLPVPSFITDLLAATQQQFDATTWGTNSSSSSQRPSGHSRRRGFDAQGLSNVLWGLAVLDLHPGHSWLAAAGAAAERLLQQGHFQPQGVAVMLWAMAKLGCRPEQSWLHTAADVAAQQVYAFKPAELSMLCHALARLHYQPRAAHQQQEQHLPPPSRLQQLPTLPEQTLQQQQSPAYQQHHHQQQEGVVQSQPLPPEAVSQHRSQQQQQQPEVPALQEPLLDIIQAVSWPQLQCLRFTEAANLLWALAVMGQQPAAGWVTSALQQLQATMHEADAKALASACYGLAKLQHAAPDWWWEAMWQHLPRVLGRTAAAPVDAACAAVHEGAAAAAASSPCSRSGSVSAAGCPYALSQSQATIMWALAKSAAQPPAWTADSLFAASEELLLLQAVNGAELMAVTSAAAMLQLQPPSSWLSAVDSMFEALLRRSCVAHQAIQLAGTASSTHQEAPQPRTHAPPVFVQQLQGQQQLQQQQAPVGQLLRALEDLLKQQQQQQAGIQPSQPFRLSAHGDQLEQQQWRHPAAKLKEVSNIVFSLARLRHVPGGAVVGALQQYLHAHAHQLTAVDQEQLQRAVQSWGDQQRQRVKAAAAAAAAMATGASAGCCCSDEASSSSSSRAVADAVPGVAHADDNCCCTAGASNGSQHATGSWDGRSGHAGQMQFGAGLAGATSNSAVIRSTSFDSLPGLVHNGCGTAVGASADDDMPVYGHYLSLAVRSHGCNAVGSPTGVAQDAGHVDVRDSTCLSHGPHGLPGRRRKALARVA